MYVALGATQVDRALDALPKCYTPELHACVNCDEGDTACYAASEYPGCDALQLAYATNYERVQTKVKALRYCPAPKLPVFPIVGAGLFGILAGALVARALR